MAENSDVSVGSNGEFVYKNIVIPNSNIVDLIIDALRNKKKPTGHEPSGYREFGHAIKKLGAYYVPNKLIRGGLDVMESSATTPPSYTALEPEEEEVESSLKAYKKRQPRRSSRIRALNLPKIEWSNYDDD